MSSSVVVYVHGVWMPGQEMMFLKLHLEGKHGLPGRLFSYPSVKGTLDENAGLLAGFVGEFVADCAAENVHIVAHSLGGVLALRMLSLTPAAPAGRVVCLGSPLCGSRAAEYLHKTDWGNLILGNSVTAGVVHEAANEWATRITEERDIGIIAGTVPVGLGRLVAKFDEPSDGTVAVSETRLPGATDHTCMPVSHSGMVLSRDVAEQVAAFLKRGKFDLDGSEPQCGD